MTPRISVRADALSALADELGGLAGQLADDGDRCRAAARTMTAALGGRAGERAGAAATAWAVLAGALAGEAAAAAGTLRTAVVAYRATDDGLAGRLAPPEQPR